MHAGCGSASALLCSVPPGSHSTSPFHLKEATSPWQRARICTRFPAHRAGLYVRMHECVVRKHIGSSPLHVCLRLKCNCCSVGLCVFVRVCVFFCEHQVQACVHKREIHTGMRTHRASHSQFVLQALFLARGAYIIRVTLWGNKRKGKTSPVFPLAPICQICSAFPPMCSLSCFFFLSWYFLVSPLLFPSLRPQSLVPPCSLPHYIFDSTSSPFSFPLLVHFCLSHNCHLYLFASPLFSVFILATQTSLPLLWHSIVLLTGGAKEQCSRRKN